MASDTALIIVAAITGIATGFSTNYGIWQAHKQEGKRDGENRQEVRRYRNHDERVRTAAEYVTAFDDFRRAVRHGSYGLADQDTKARALSDVAGRLELYFDESVIAVRKEAEERLVAEHRRNRGLPPEPPEEPIKEVERRLIAAMKHQLEGVPVNNGPASPAPASSFLNWCALWPGVVVSVAGTGCRCRRVTSAPARGSGSSSGRKCVISLAFPDLVTLSWPITAPRTWVTAWDSYSYGEPQSSCRSPKSPAQTTSRACPAGPGTCP